ncbi:hypothetical protein SAMN05443287_102666 [Micromonospora phaseoli]|uniref:Uncharacterized protein n=1 Tax=Micromonospora phaseoli TaxID=1144548 RepID=A0A1H6VHQ0_9ACTN|nr:hypothetical protein [Micromonospora phaseoli]PZV93581.1 hypothetical protein CLV64_10940 [Micromonospora phaseoli]GIJ80212.1 hypothetical protein Xph01_46440 [Micromonospora phaseoli]SEJ03216.1 hypothetical protein SAMN05443287_102666 [Micromonospora phaseoli]
MVDTVVLVIVVVGARLAYSLVSLYTWPARARARAENMAVLLWVAGPGGVVETTGPDGAVIVRRAPVLPASEVGR